MHDHDDTEELMVLAHEPKPGYRTVFYVVIAIALAYMAYIFAN